MKYRIEYNPVGFLEYNEAFEWYLERSEAAADNFAKEILKKIEIISLDPFRFRNTYDIFRETAMNKFPYSIVYAVDEANRHIVIVSVYHHKRNPRRKYKK